MLYQEGIEMIRHICMFQLKEENKEEHLKMILEKVQILKDIEQIQSFDVVVNAKEASSKNYDLSLIFDFQSIEDLNIYRDHPLHVAFRSFITPLRDLRACIDYEFEEHYED